MTDDVTYLDEAEGEAVQPEVRSEEQAMEKDDDDIKLEEETGV